MYKHVPSWHGGPASPTNYLPMIQVTKLHSVSTWPIYRSIRVWDLRSWKKTRSPDLLFAGVSKMKLYRDVTYSHLGKKGKSSSKIDFSGDMMGYVSSLEVKQHEMHSNCLFPKNHWTYHELKESSLDFTIIKPPIFFNKNGWIIRFHPAGFPWDKENSPTECSSKPHFRVT